MLRLLLRRVVIILVTALRLTFVIFWIMNLGPSLKRIAVTEVGSRITSAEMTSWLDENGYGRPLLLRDVEWLGLVPGWTSLDEDGTIRGHCVEPRQDRGAAPNRCGILQGDWDYSPVFRAEVVARSLGPTAKLMFWVMVVMVPSALLVGVVAGMREGSKTDRLLSTGSILTTAT